MIGRKSLLIVLTKGVSAILGFAGLFLITRYFSESAYGQIAYTMALVGLFYSFADLGFSTAHIKRVNEGKDPGDCLSTYLTIKLTLTVTFVVIVIASFWLWTDVLGHPLTDTSFELLTVFVLYYTFFNISQMATATFDAFQQTAKTQTALIVEMAVRVPLIIILAIPTESTFALATCYMVGGLAVMLVSFLFLFRDHIKLKRPTLLKSYSKFALPLAFAVVIGVIVVNIDKVALGFFWGSVEVANYAAGQSIMTMLFVFGAALSTLLFPTFSRLYENGNSNSMSEIVRKGERYLSFILTPIVCVLLVQPVLIATVLLSGKYIGSAEVIQVLSLNVLTLGLGGVYSTHIVASNRAKDVAWLSALQLFLLMLFIVLFVPTAFFGIPMLGMKATGTALALLCTTLIIVFLSRLIIWKMTGLGYNRRMTMHLPAGLLSIAVLYALGITYSPERWYDILLLWAVSCAVFYGFLYIVKELERGDIAYFAEVVNPKEMLIYLRSEFKGK